MTNRNVPQDGGGARERRRRKRRRAAGRRAGTPGTALAVLAVLGAVGLAGAVAAGRGGPEAAPITDGSRRAPVTLTLYEDFRCPGCAHFEHGFGRTLRRLQDGGRLRVEHRLVAVVDGNVGGRGSAYAANAAACARDEGRFREYRGVLFAGRPQEPDDAFGDSDRLLELAEEVEGLSGPDFTRCVREGTHLEWVERSTEAFLRAGHDSTPTVLLDGEDLFADPAALPGPRELEERVEAAARTA
ncbi:hypothetical protein GCM10010420_51210 [Streptomyces glaucosporus]|uniref:Thioredoxin-like fold domain-containing protein n=1 Tax=Streptomyces glaucosporus TaxID=284044 RepID=A0ABN3IX96_9ACTN